MNPFDPKLRREGRDPWPTTAHTITPEQLGTAYEGLLKDKDNYLGVLVKWV